MNDEDDVINRIDKLVDEQLAQERSGYDHNINQDRCHLCKNFWHGLPASSGCPGAFASEAEAAAWQETPPPVVCSNDVDPDVRLVDILQSMADGLFALLGIPAGTGIPQAVAAFAEEFDVDSLPEDERPEAREVLARIRHEINEGNS